MVNWGLFMNRTVKYYRAGIFIKLPEPIKRDRNGDNSINVDLFYMKENIKK